jgi:hypothetical protein
VARNAAELLDRYDRLSADCDEYRRGRSWTPGTDTFGVELATEQR